MKTPARTSITTPDRVTLAMLQMAPQRTVPTPIAVALATAVGAAERLRGRPSELNAETVGYLTRTGGYSRAKAVTAPG